MANGYSFRSAAEVNKIAESFGTSIDAEYLAKLAAKYSTKSTAATYNVPDSMSDRLYNISNFILGTSVKDSAKADDSETIVSFVMGKLLMKYFETGLDGDDAVKLISYASECNKSTDRFIKDYFMTAVFGAGKEEGSSFIKDAVVPFLVKYYDTITLGNDILIGSSGVGTKLKDDLGVNSDIAKSSGILELLAYIAVFDIIKTYLSDSSDSNAEITLSSDDEVVYSDAESYLKNSDGSSYFYSLDGSSYIKTNFSSYYKKRTLTISVSGKMKSSQDESTSQNYQTPIFSFPFITETHTRSLVSLSKSSVISSSSLFILNSNGVYEPAQYKLNDVTMYPLEKDIKISISECSGNPFGSVSNLSQLPSDNVFLKKDMFNASDGRSSDSEILAYYKMAWKKSMMMYQIASSSSDDPKSSASMDEFISADNGELVSEISLRHVSITDEQASAINSAASSDPGKNVIFSADDAESSKGLNLNFIYKEMNQAYRESEFSDLIEYALAGINSSIASFSSGIFDQGNRYSSILGYNNTRYISEDAQSCIASLRTHPYKCRRSRESDIIRYFEGDYIGYGKTADERKEIARFLGIYNETRNYYYRNLLNKSFVLDDYYKQYERELISIYSLIRFLGAKVDDLTDINYYDDDDVNNFFDSYGLSGLKSKSFTNQSEYRKRMVANYNSLVKNKGSRGVISILQSIFSDSIYTMTMNRYVLVNKTSGTFALSDDKKTVSVNYPDSGNNLIFVKIPYDSVNEHESVVKAIKKNDYISYSDFISDDSAYWKAEASSLPKDITGAISTKYDGFELSESIAKAYAITRYCISAMGLIEGITTPTKSSSDAKVSTILSQGTQTPTTEDSGYSNKIGIYQYYRAIKEIYEYYIFRQSKENTYPVAAMSIGYAINNQEVANYGDAEITDLIKNLKTVISNGISSLSPTSNIDSYKTVYSSIISDMSKLLLDMSEVMVKSSAVSGLSFVDRIEFYILGLYGIDVIRKSYDQEGYSDSSAVNTAVAVYMKLMAAASSDATSFSAISVGSNADFGIIYNYLIYPMIRLPVDYYGNGLLNQSSDLFISYKAWKLIECVMDKIYISENLSDAERNRNLASFSGTETLTDATGSDKMINVFLGLKPDSVSTSDILSKLLDMISDAETIAESKDGMMVSYSTTANSDNAVAFVTKAIEMFISYTSQIYDIRMYKSYDTKSECVPISENIVHSHSSVKSESVSYDESVTIAKMA